MATQGGPNRVRSEDEDKANYSRKWDSGGSINHPSLPSADVVDSGGSITHVSHRVNLRWHMTAIAFGSRRVPTQTYPTPPRHPDGLQMEISDGGPTQEAGKGRAADGEHAASKRVFAGLLARAGIEGKRMRGAKLSEPSSERVRRHCGKERLERSKTARGIEIVTNSAWLGTVKRTRHKSRDGLTVLVSSMG